MSEYDVIAIGGGAAGLTIAAGGARLGLRVALIERERIGGECTWTGCVPSKALLHVARAFASARQAVEWSKGRRWRPRADFEKVRAYVHSAREEIAQHETPEALEHEFGVTVIRGEGQVKGDGVVEVDGRRVTSRHVVICTGSEPNVPYLPGMDETRVLTNETIFDELDDLPERLAIIGGGSVGCELAQAFSRLGSMVTLFEEQERLLPREDPSVAPVIRVVLERDGVRVHTGAKLQRITPVEPGGLRATVSAEGLEDVPTDAIFIAAGRRARTTRTGLVEIGVQMSKDGIVVDDHLRTSVPGIWATGDVVGPFRLTHAAEMQSRLVLRNILFPWRMARVNYRVLPWCTFTDPQVGRVGLTEDEARGAGEHNLQVSHLPMSRVDRAVTENSTEGFVKLITRGRHILGAQIVGPAAGEMTQQVALAMHHRLPVSALGMVTVYPSMSYALHQVGDLATKQLFSRTWIGSPLLGIVRRLALQ